MELAVRASSDPLSLAAMVRDQVHQLDKDQSVADIRTLAQVVNASLAQPRLNTLLLAAFAALAVLLAATGLYGVMAYSVAQRTREIGIRMALGAERQDVLRLVVKHGLVLTLIGVGVGLVAASALTHFLSSMLYGVKPIDPLTFGIVSLTLAAVALLASYIPARRATKVDPITALRYE